MKRIFFDVDTQNDFISPNGALAVPGAGAIKPNLKRLTDYAIRKGAMVMGSVDRHYGDFMHVKKERELKRWGGELPEHCMTGTVGQEKIPETMPRDPPFAFVENREYREGELKALVHGKRRLYFEKQGYDVFENPNLKIVLDAGVSEEVIVYGVPTDYSVLAAVFGFRRLEKSVLVVLDAIKARENRHGDGERALKEMKECGALFRTTLDIVGKKVGPTAGQTADSSGRLPPRLYQRTAGQACPHGRRRGP